MERNHQNENEGQLSLASANQNIDSVQATETIQPPPLQLKAINTGVESEGEQENGEYQLKEKEYTSGAAENPPDESNSNNQPFQLKPKENNTGLPDNLKSGVENLSGYSMDDVKVHYNSSKPAQLQAHAYAQGTDIHIGPGQERHLSHEAWHVVQQKQGRVKPTMQLKAFNINDDAGLEKEADVMGAKASQHYNPGNDILRNQKPSQLVAQRAEGKVDPGDNLPTMNALVSERFKANFNHIREGQRQARALRDAFNLSQNDDLFTQLRNQTNDELGRFGVNIPAMHGDLIQAFIAAHTGLKENIQEAKTAVEEDVADIHGGTALSEKFFDHALNYTMEQIDSTETLADEWITLNANLQVPGQPLTDDEKRGFSDALKQLPTISNLLNAHRGNGIVTGHSDWADGGSLSDQIDESDENSDGESGTKSPRREIDNGNFLNKVNAADTHIRNLVEHHILGTITKPRIVVHTKYSGGLHKKQNTLRAHQNGDQVHVAQDEDMHVIVHEVFHYIEDKLTDLWIDVQTLMRARHLDSTNSSGKDPNLAGHGSLGMREEGRFRGEYPATGKYTSSAYENIGSTEITSMTVEFLSNKKKAKTMIEKDPQQTATVLRNILPNEYRDTAALRPYDQYLPH